MGADFVFVPEPLRRWWTAPRDLVQHSVQARQRPSLNHFPNTPSGPMAFQIPHSPPRSTHRNDAKTVQAKITTAYMKNRFTAGTASARTEAARVSSKTPPPAPHIPYSLANANPPGMRAGLGAGARLVGGGDGVLHGGGKAAGVAAVEVAQAQVEEGDARGDAREPGAEPQQQRPAPHSLRTQQTQQSSIRTWGAEGGGGRHTFCLDFTMRV